MKYKFQGDKGDITSDLKLIGYEKPKLVKKYGDGFVLYTSTYFWLKPYDRGMPYANLCYGRLDTPDHYRPSEAVKITS